MNLSSLFYAFILRILEKMIPWPFKQLSCQKHWFPSIFSAVQGMQMFVLLPACGIDFGVKLKWDPDVFALRNFCFQACGLWVNFTKAIKAINKDTVFIWPLQLQITPGCLPLVRGNALIVLQYSCFSTSLYCSRNASGRASFLALKPLPGWLIKLART